MHDRDLLSRFLADRDEQAFAELVRRHIGLVHAAAQRQTKDPATAEDITQSVFVLLAQKARTIRNRESIAGWLLVTTRCAALNTLRAESRRQRHEQIRAAMNHEARPDDDVKWDAISPLLDEAVAKLKPDDRDALTLRYFQDQSVADVAVSLGVSEDAAKKRVQRAIERLRAMFVAHGMMASPEALGSLLAAHALTTVATPACEQITHAALSAGRIVASASAGAAKTSLVVPAIVNTKIGVGALVAILVTAVSIPIIQQVSRGRAATAPPAPATTPPAPATAPADDWRARFNAVYGLTADQSLKRVRPPYIAERRAILETLNFRGGPGAFAPEFGTCVFEWIGQGARFRQGHADTADLGQALKDLLGVWPQDTDIERALIALPVPGDWVVRPEPSAKKVTEFFTAMEDVVGKGTKLQTKEMLREAVVVGGAIDYARLKPRGGEFAQIRFYRGASSDRNNNMWAAQSAREMLQGLGETIGQPVVVEADLRENSFIGTITEQSAALSRAPDPPDDVAVDEIIANVARQSGLELTREWRTLPAWHLAFPATTQPATP